MGMSSDDSLVSAPVPSAGELCEEDDAYVFFWNSRQCFGSTVHQFVLEREVQELETLLQLQPSAATEVAKYTTVFQQQPQEGSAQPIHLAASRNFVDKVRVLIKYGASVDAMVTRGSQPHYDVLSAAVWAEGAGGSLEMVKLLMSENAEMTLNLDNKTPLHLAFMTGCTPVIEYLQSGPKKGSTFFAGGQDKGPGMMTPLECGINTARMSQMQLAMAAPATPSSLKTFMEKDPGCIPAFLQRVRCSESKILGKALANVINVADLCMIMRRDRVAAAAMLDAVTDTPHVQHPGFHPLPKRILMTQTDDVWALGNWFSMLRNTNHYLSFYEQDDDWQYDSRIWSSPAWHSKVSAGKKEELHRTVDVEIKVCHVPNLICAELFDALMNSSEGEWAIFDNPAIKGMIQYAWLQGASNVNFATVMTSFWVLVLLVYEHVFKRWQNTKSPGVQFVIARGLVDLQNEILQYLGYWAINRRTAYFSGFNFADVLQCGLPILLVFFDGTMFSTIVKVTVVLICWLRLLSALGSKERIAKVVLPLTRLVFALGPALAVTGIAFMACLHAIALFEDVSDVQNHEVWYNTFTLLLAGDFTNFDSSETPDAPDAIEIWFVYAFVCLFTVFLLNIFIAITGEQYIKEKERSEQTFLRTRAGEILAYLLRARVVPCYRLHPRAAKLCSWCAFLCGISLQCLHYTCSGCGEDNSPRWGLPLYWFILTVITVCSFQQSKPPWMAKPLCPSEADKTECVEADSSVTLSTDSWNDLGRRRPPTTTSFSSHQPSAGEKEEHFLWIVRRASDVAEDKDDAEPMPGARGSEPMRNHQVDRLRSVIREEIARALRDFSPPPETV